LRVRLQDRSNAAYWLAKIASNRNRDRRVNIELRRAGWKVVRIWEGDLLRAPDLAAARVVATLNTR
jgi:DNA mismatch endonuclease (patch repair protein)